MIDFLSIVLIPAVHCNLWTSYWIVALLFLQDAAKGYLKLLLLTAASGDSANGGAIQRSF